MTMNYLIFQKVFYYLKIKESIYKIPKILIGIKIPNKVKGSHLKYNLNELSIKIINN
jgi:hypothetical protein